MSNITRLGNVIITSADIEDGQGEHALVIGFSDGGVELSVTDMETALELGKLHDDTPPDVIH